MDTKNKNKKPELLLPAGSLTVLKIAILYGADAVYIGGEAYSLRAKATNFSMDEMAEGIRFAHQHGKKVYVTANIFAHNGDLTGVAKYFEELAAMPEKPDGLLIADPGVFRLAREAQTGIDLHISTQANTTNYESARFWFEQGAKRIVCARELSMKEITVLRKKMPAAMELEAFVHGAMCISYSGRCLLSSYFTGRDSNRGACTHPCRWEYAIAEQTRPEEYLPIEETDRGTFIMNSKDLCMIEHIPELVEAGVDSLKIEGRMKSALYVAAAARTYRMAIDDYFSSEESYRGHLDIYRKEIAECTLRGFTEGFYFGRPGPDAHSYDNSTYIRNSTYLGYVEEVRKDTSGVQYRLTQKNKFSVGETIEVMKPKGDNIQVQVLSITDADGQEMASAPHPKQTIWVRLSERAEAYDILRRKEPETYLKKEA